MRPSAASFFFPFFPSFFRSPPFPVDAAHTESYRARSCVFFFSFSSPSSYPTPFASSYKEKTFTFAFLPPFPLPSLPLPLFEPPSLLHTSDQRRTLYKREQGGISADRHLPFPPSPLFLFFSFFLPDCLLVSRLSPVED